MNDKSLINEPLRKRRELLIKHFPFTENKLMHAVSMDLNDVDQIQEFLDQSVKDGCEGLMIKTLDTDAHYEISKRSHNWLKVVNSVKFLNKYIKNNFKSLKKITLMVLVIL